MYLKKIHWSATDAGEELSETKSISISLWDHVQKNSNENRLMDE